MHFPPRLVHCVVMAAKKGAKNDLNAPLRSLSDRLRAMQREAGQILETVRSEPRHKDDSKRPGSGRIDLAAGLEVQLDRVVTSLIDRWDLPTRADLTDIVRRLERIESALAPPPRPTRAKKSAQPAKKVARKTIRRRPPSPTKTNKPR